MKVIATTCLHLAGKVKDDTLKIRDVINVARNTLQRGSQPLELGEQYWSMRDAIVQAELLIMRMLKFHVMPDHPHRVIISYFAYLANETNFHFFTVHAALFKIFTSLVWRR